MSDVINRFMRYVQIDTQSEEDSDTFPSTEKQKVLGRMLADELEEMGASNVYFDEQYCYVYAKLPASEGREHEDVLGFIAHMDTSPETSGANVQPRIVENYDGKPICLNEADAIYLSPEQFPELLEYVGQGLIVTNGHTLLGADDKAGIAEIMSMVSYLLTHKECSHGPIAIGFTPDEEIGAGVDHFDLERFGANYAYTVDGGGIGELEYENFNAASLDVVVHGITVHPGEAKGKMKNAALIAMEFEQRLPRNEKPEFTEGYEGFFHLTHMEGAVEEAKLSYIVRDHDRDKFEMKKQLVQSVADEINAKYDEGTIQIAIEDSYYNMKEKIIPDNAFLIERVVEAMKEEGVIPKIQPIRGGTDGARLSFMGLPCPNICTGGHNYHGRYEYVCVESMKKIVEVLIRIVL